MGFVVFIWYRVADSHNLTGKTPLSNRTKDLEDTIELELTGANETPNKTAWIYVDF
jgi:hypothetical protein